MRDGMLSGPRTVAIALGAEGPGAGGWKRPSTPVPWAGLARLGGGDELLPVDPSDRTEVGRPAERTAAAPLGLLVISSPVPSLIGNFFEVGAAELVVGRGAEASVRVEDSGISRRHLRIARVEGRYLAQDLGSTNGTWVNGVRIRAAAQLAEGDRLQLGSSTELLFGTRTDGATEEARLRQALAATGAGAWQWDASTGALTLSGGLARDVAGGTDTTEPCPEDAWSTVHEADREAARAHLQEAARAGGHCALDCRLVRRDGTVAWVALRGEVVRDGDGPVRIAGTAMDVTERKRVEQEMRRQSLLLDSLSDGVAAVGFDGTVLDWNARAQVIFGWSKAEAVGQGLAELLARGREEEPTRALLARAAQGERVAEERLLRRRDGSHLAVELVAVPLRDPEGNQLACVAVLRDVDERRRMASQLQMAERLASLGTLAAGVAHEINNPLAYIGANLSWIRRRLEALGPALGEGQAELVGALTDCQEGAERIRTIVQDLKTYSTHDADVQVGPLDVNTVLEFAIRVSDNEVRQRARLVRELTAGLPRVSGGHARLGQVFLDLLVNASQAIASGGQNENEVRVRSRLDGEMVLVEVEDTGSGISPEVLPRIFDPFFTTKPVGGGTGLGLFICHGIITGMGGRIAAESQPGRGTTFRVWLPPAAPPQPTPAPTRPRVLVVDDEPLLGLSIQRLLSPAQEVVVETSPEAALRRVVGGERFDVAMLDMVMPGMNGLELHARLREVAPSLAARTVFVFGGTLEPGVEAALDRLGAPRVSKPFDLRQLAEVVAALLAGGPARG